ncbi:MAG: hypothetical protein UT05_C0005G0044 [Parcubacteria group bacterium GW2011_GWF2_38_76]|nr:MAG: hypothetical protein UT05_C0005G0044 [Parcubacteria group bacterium GW2011_GWF2_38_76]HBM45614.1 hypothetical protein [Patescibacteria group bacterium]
MTILNDIKEKIKGYKEEIFIVLIITLCLLIGFGLGRLSKIADKKTPITIEMPKIGKEIGLSNINTSTSTEIYVASKNGTRYYSPWCEGVKKISPKNIVEFTSREEAESAGYTKATNCPGL